MKRKSNKILTTTLLLSTMLSFSAFADWEQVGTQWKYKDEVTDGYVASQWIESTTEKGLWYYLDENGVMAVNTTTPDGYYVNELGEWRESIGGSNNSSPVDNSNNNNSQSSGDVRWGFGDISNVTSGGSISESEKASGENFVNHR